MKVLLRGALATIYCTGLWLAGAPSVAAADEPADPTERCQALQKTDFLNLPDAPTQVTRATLATGAGDIIKDWERQTALEVVDQTRKDLADIQPFCHIKGFVLPAAGFELLLPVSHWNGKFLHIGCGGWCGTTVYAALVCAAHGQYACITTDMGHTQPGGLWFRNNLQAQMDFSHRATHGVTLAGKAIAERYYARAPKKSYFMGCSTGGYQALVEAQRYPWDFDGIIAGAPDMDESDLAVRGLWIKKNFFDQDGKPVLSSADIQRLHEAVLARCDRDDGVKDGIVGDPVHCAFDPAQLQCKSKKDVQCLTAGQVQAVKNIYGAPVTSKGEPISTRGVFPGSELSWEKSFPVTWGDIFFKDTALLDAPGKKWTATDFDFDRDYKRSGAGVLFANTNPDLRRFKAAGGKLLSYQGGNDAVEIPGAIVDYYETVERTLGGRAATQDFFRLFLMPAMGHCGGGEGADTADFLGSLEAWVERGVAPDKIVSGRLKEDTSVKESTYDPLHAYRPLPEDRSKLSFTRPLYPYPLYARYKGSGDPNDADHFEAVKP
jgi:feruloyl esterase